MAKDVKIRVDVDAKAASQEFDTIADAAEDAQKAITEVSDAKVDPDVSAVLSSLDLVAAEAKETAAAAEVLGQALGPELAAKADTTRAVGQLREMGLSFDQITANADQLGAKLKELADADVGGQLGSSLGTARGQMDDLGKSADSSRSAMANMIGNTTQDMGELAGVTGSAGVAIGQMGEYMADAMFSGESLASTLKSFGAVAGPMAGLALATVVIGEFQKKAEEAKQAMEELKKSQEALATGDTAQFVQGLTDQYGDLILGLQEAGVSTEDFMAALDAGTAEEFAAAIQSQTEAGTQNAATWDVISGRLDKLQSDWTRNEAAIHRNDEATRTFAEGMGLVVTSTGELVSAQEAAASATDLVAEATTGATEALQAHLDAQRAAVDSQFALREATDDFHDSLAELDGKLAEIAASDATAESKARDYQRALDDNTQSAMAMADAAVRQAEEQALVNGETFTATDATKVYRDGLMLAAATAEGPARDAILAYVAELDKIPPTKPTQITVTEVGLSAVQSAINAVADANYRATIDVYANVGRAVTDIAHAAVAGQRSMPAVNVTINAPGGVYGDAGINQLADALTSSLATRLGAGLR